MEAEGPGFGSGGLRSGSVKGGGGGETPEVRIGGPPKMCPEAVSQSSDSDEYRYSRHHLMQRGRMTTPGDHHTGLGPAGSSPAHWAPPTRNGAACTAFSPESNHFEADLGQTLGDPLYPDSDGAWRGRKIILLTGGVHERCGSHQQGHPADRQHARARWHTLAGKSC